jgi:S-adenosyl-L-methionine hydrolase (adenosine-forming)
MTRPTAARPLLALLTDFGTRDPYVGAMKGVALGICPELSIVDLTHEIAPHDVAEGARHLRDVAPYLPADAAIVAVVDPGVGSGRRAIAARAGDRWFLGPDNGLFAEVFARTPPTLVVEIADPRYMRPQVSRTFEGRDRFAPAAAWLLSGVPLAALGPAITDPTGLAAAPADDSMAGDGVLAGTLVSADRFGNVLTSIDRVVFDVFAGAARVEVRLGATPLRLVATYAEIGDGEVAALFGSAGWLEIAARAAPALGRPGVTIGAPVHVCIQP